MNTLAELRLSTQDEADLRWFWTESDGAMGLRSLFPAQIAQLQIGAGRRGTHTPVQHELDGRLVEAATRARLISRALETMPRGHVRVLRAAYTETRHQPLRPIYGDLAELVVETDAAQRAHRRSRTTRSLTDWISRLAKRAGKGEAEPKRILYLVRSEAESKLVAAHRAYTEARRRWLRTVPRRRHEAERDAA